MGFESRFGPDELPVRACQCGFCRAHGARTAADPEGRVRFEGMERDGSFYAGPFLPARFARKTMSLTHRLFGIRSCNETITGARGRPCLDLAIAQDEHVGHFLFLGIADLGVHAFAT